MGDRHEGCASHVSSTCVYLRDGTKVVVRRDGARAWLEHLQQETLRTAGETAPAEMPSQAGNHEKGKA